MITLSAIAILHACMQLFRTVYGIMSETSTEVLYFDRNHLPTGVSIDSVSSRSFLACASLCHPNDCKSLFYDESSHWCRINVGIVAFPAGTTFHSRTPDYIKFVEFQRVSFTDAERDVPFGDP